MGVQSVFRRRVTEVACHLVNSRAGLDEFKSNVFTAPVVAWMEETGIIEKGRLAPSLVTLKTRLARPVRCCGESRIGIRHFLEQTGWSRTETGREASLTDKSFNHTGPVEYYQLLKHHLERLCQYEEMFDFRHSQSKGYYDCFLAFFSHRSADPRLDIASILPCFQFPASKCLVGKPASNDIFR